MKIIIFIFLIFLFFVSCGPVSPYEEDIDVAVLAQIELFGVPDTTVQNNIPVRLKGIIGGTTAYRFDKINHLRQDSLFLIAVWGRYVQKTGVKYEIKDISFDTTIVLTTQLLGVHYVEIISSLGILTDTTFVISN